MRTRSFFHAALALLLLAPNASADIEITAEGRSSRTTHKLSQSQLGEIPLDQSGSTSTVPRASGRQMRSGRYLRARPTEDFSVGLMGPPGTTTILDAIGGVFIDLGDWRRPRRPKSHHRSSPRAPR